MLLWLSSQSDMEELDALIAVQDAKDKLQQAIKEEEDARRMAAFEAGGRDIEPPESSEEAFGVKPLDSSEASSDGPSFIVNALRDPGGEGIGSPTGKNGSFGSGGSRVPTPVGAFFAEFVYGMYVFCSTREKIAREC